MALKICSFLFLLMTTIFFLSPASYAHISALPGCISLEEFNRLPGETISEVMRVESQEYRGHFFPVAKKMRKHSAGFDVVFLVFDSNMSGGGMPPQPLFLTITKENSVPFRFAFDSEGRCMPAYSDIVHSQLIYGRNILKNGKNFAQIIAIRFFLEAVAFDGKKQIIERTFFLQDPFHFPIIEDQKTENGLRNIDLYIYVENSGHATLCKDVSREQCRAIIFSLFAQAIQRFREEFGIVLRIDTIQFNFPIDRSFSVLPDDKKEIENLVMYWRNLSSLAYQLREQNEDIEIVFGIAENLPAGSSALANIHYGAVLLYANDPVLERSIIHELSHMFCARDTDEPNVMMNGHGYGINDPFLPQDIETILRNKNRFFSVRYYYCR